MGKITKRLGLSRSKGSFDGSNGYEGDLCAMEPTSLDSVETSLFSDSFFSASETVSSAFSFGTLAGTFDSFSDNTLRGLCKAQAKVENEFSCLQKEATVCAGKKAADESNYQKTHHN